MCIIFIPKISGYDIIPIMKTTPWEVSNKNISDAYIAGFLDGDGSIVASIEKRPDRRRFPYRVRLKINFTQHIRHQGMILLLQKALGGIGSIRDVSSHNLVELVIQKRSDVQIILKRLLPYLILKERQARIMLGMIDIFNQGIVNVRSSLSDKDFEKLFSMAKEIRKMNSGTGGKKEY